MGQTSYDMMMMMERGVSETQQVLSLNLAVLLCLFTFTGEEVS
jgi:hypothetical protein